MKEYSNPSRKPMMYGGDSRKEMRTGGDAKANADTQSRLATGRATAADKKADDAQRREEISRMPMAEIRKLAEGSGREAMIAKEVLRKKGDKGAMPSGDKEPTQ